MYKNIFIYLALATAIDGCRGGIRTKRISDPIKSDEAKHVFEASKSLASDSEISAALKQQNKRALEKITMDTFAGELQQQHQLRASRELANIETDHVHQPADGESIKMNKGMKENLIEDKGKQATKRETIKSSVKDAKIGSKIYEQDEHVRFERTVGVGSGIGNDHDNNQEQSGLKHLRKFNKRNGMISDSKMTSSSTEDHLGSPKKIVEESKLEGQKRDNKPDMDIYLYSNMPSFYKTPPMLLEMYNTKEGLAPTSYDRYYPPYKWIQRRSPVQSAFEIANMMVKVGLDELDSEDYSEHVPFMFDSNQANKGPNHKFDRALNAEASFCPIHTSRKAPLNGELGDLEGSPRFGECLCSYTRRSIKDGSSKSAEEPDKIRRGHELISEEHPDIKRSMTKLKPF